MPNYNNEILSNNADLQAILEEIKALPVPETPNISVSSNGLITATALGKSATQQLSTQAAATITPGTSSKTAVASGKYTTGAVTVEGDADLVADNIRAGKSIFGVTGTSWAGNLTFSGTYATSTYYTAAGCYLTVDKDTGRAFVTIQGGTSTSYENIYFTATSLPSGVTMLAPAGGTAGANFGTAGATQLYHTVVLTGVTGKINVAVNMSTRANTSYDAVNCALTVTYA